MELNEYIAQIKPADRAAMEEAQKRWNSIAKPLGSLGALEDAVIAIAGMTGSAKVDISRRAVIAMCADNGVVRQGVTQTGQEVTAIVTENMGRRASSVCRMAALAHAEVYPVDIGVAVPVEGERIVQRCVRRGTADFTEGPAMTRDEAIKAILTGIELVGQLREQGVKLFATGEMGIGNTTTSSAVVSVLLEKDPELVTGRGAGLSSEGLERKIDAIRRGIELNKPDKNDVIDLISKVGGLDIAGLCGVFLGGGIYRVPVLIDGFISSAAALCAQRLCPACADYMLGSHASAEPAGAMVLEALGMHPFIHAGMRLGEGTGAVAVMPLLDMAMAIYGGMDTFEDIAVEAYQPLS
ncbi:MAG: nicotinate-nucleotide--dimethylbenzimidazole phosphoribosyltransferase [Candidatus Heteroscillospira sp.]|jgi:nicotinate-nucleotide--dimethylbenzimidazole phosphoribosyltransferase